VSYFGGGRGGRGDPGFFGTLFGTAKRIAGAAFGATPIGAAIAAARPPRSTQSVFVPPSQIGPIGTTAAQLGLGLAAQGLSQKMAASSGAGGGGCQSGFHPNKSNYFLIDGTFVPRGSRCVKNRRRNQFNRSAALKSASRLKSLGKGMKTIKKSLGEASRGVGNKG